MTHDTVYVEPVKVSPEKAARLVAAEITRCELDATDQMRRGDEQAAVVMLARAGGLADAHALVTGQCRTCGRLVGQRHDSETCRSGNLLVGGRGPSDPVYCVDEPPARRHGSFEAMVAATGGHVESRVWTPEAA